MEEQEIYAIIGDDGFQRLVAAFYRQIPTGDVLGPLYAGHDFDGAERRLRDFLMFRFGGPATYLETRGHPRLRMWHASFALGGAARDRWVYVRYKALDEAVLPENVHRTLKEFFGNTATFLMNRPE